MVGTVVLEIPYCFSIGKLVEHQVLYLSQKIPIKLTLQKCFLYQKLCLMHVDGGKNSLEIN